MIPVEAHHHRCAGAGGAVEQRERRLHRGAVVLDADERDPSVRAVTGTEDVLGAEQPSVDRPVARGEVDLSDHPLQLSELRDDLRRFLRDHRHPGPRGRAARLVRGERDQAPQRRLRRDDRGRGVEPVGGVEQDAGGAVVHVEEVDVQSLLGGPAELTKAQQDAQVDIRRVHQARDVPL